MQLRGDRTRVMSVAVVACVAAAVLFVSAVGRPPETVLIASSPAQGTTVTAPVGAVRLSFSTDLSEAHVAVQGGAEQDSAVAGRTVVAPVVITTPGSYRIAYHVRTTAGHDLSGSLTFAVGGAGAPGVAPPTEAAAHHGARLDWLTASVLAVNVLVMTGIGVRLWTTRSRRPGRPGG